MSRFYGRLPKLVKVCDRSATVRKLVGMKISLFVFFEKFLAFLCLDGTYRGGSRAAIGFLTPVVDGPSFIGPGTSDGSF